MKKAILSLLLSLCTFSMALGCPSATDCGKSVMCKANQFYDKGDYHKAYSIYLKKANTGDIEAQTKVAEMYKHGKGVKQSDKKAFEWFLKAAQKDNAYAQAWIGGMYISGEGVDKNTKLGVYWWGKSADAGYAWAQDSLANIYRNGHYDYSNDKRIADVEVDVKKAIELYEKSAKQGNEDAQYNLGRIYYEGRVLDDSRNVYYAKIAPQDYKKAFYWYFKVAAQGNTEAQTRLGVMYDQGFGIDQDYKQAFNWYSVAADKGDAFARINLAWMYENGKGVDKDINKAAYYYNLAAWQGDVASALKFSLLINSGSVVFKNDEANRANKENADKFISEIDEWSSNFSYWKTTFTIIDFGWATNFAGSGVKNEYQKLFDWELDKANKGDIKAQFSVARMYSFGLGVDKDEEHSFDWTLKAAEGDLPVAQDALGWKLADKKDYSKAVEWWTKAANKGYEAAQFSLIVNIGGQANDDFPLDRVEAYKWIYILSKDKKDYNFSYFTKKMTPAERKEGEKRAAEWLATHPKKES